MISSSSAFVIGFGIDAAAMLIIYKVGQILFDYVRDRTLLSAEELLRYRDEEEIERTVDTAGRPGAGEFESGNAVKAAASFVLKILIGVAVLFAVLAPLLTHLTVREAIRRALAAARTNDIVIGAGKGHENYQLVGTQKRHFSDQEEIIKFLREKKHV